MLKLYRSMQKQTRVESIYILHHFPKTNLSMKIARVALKITIRKTGDLNSGYVI